MISEDQTATLTFHGVGHKLETHPLNGIRETHLVEELEILVLFIGLNVFKIAGVFETNFTMFQIFYQRS